jgi:hypothetical protein
MAMDEISRRPLMAYGLVAAAALAVGYFLTSPLDYTSFAGLLAVCMLLLTPILLRWHHLLLVLAWNASIVVFFMPGTPALWMPLGVVSLVFAVGATLLAGRIPYPPSRLVGTSLILLGLVALVTGYLRGGVGLATFGSGVYGGKSYYHIVLAILGYFALAATPVPPRRAALYAGLFVLSGVTCLLSNLIYSLGENFYILYLFFRVDLAIPQATAEFSQSGMMRLTGVGLACASFSQFMLLRYGIRGIFSLQHPVRFVVFAVSTVMMLFSGFRTLVLLIAILFAVQFCLERLFSTRIFLFCAFGLVLGGVLLVGFASHLPLAVQRSLSVLPLPLDPVARLDAEASTDWRINMWKALLPELPKYVLLGKGYAISPSDLIISEESVRRGFADPALASMVAGDYHNGPLSVYIPLGSLGLLAFVFFLVASFRLLYRHYRRGDPALQTTNTFLLSAFIAQAILFLFVFGSLNTQLYVLVGIVGLSVALNRQSQKAAAAEHDEGQPVSAFPAWSSSAAAARRVAGEGAWSAGWGTPGEAPGRAARS